MNFVFRNVVLSIFLVCLFSVESYGWTYNDLSGYLENKDRDAFKQYLNTGTIVPRLPRGAQPVVVEDIQYYKVDGTWYLPIKKTGVEYATQGERVIQFIVVLPPV